MTGANLRAFRQSLGLTDRGFSRALGLPETTDGAMVRKWERDLNPVPRLVVTIVELAERYPEARELLRERGARNTKPAAG